MGNLVQTSNQTRDKARNKIEDENYVESGILISSDGFGPFTMWGYLQLSYIKYLLTAGLRALNALKPKFTLPTATAQTNCRLRS